MTIQCDENTFYQEDGWGNVVSPDEVDCSDCENTIYMQVFVTNTGSGGDPEDGEGGENETDPEGSWVFPCGDTTCLLPEHCGEVEGPVTLPQDPLPSGMPTPSGTFPGGQAPSGAVELDCGTSSKWFNHTFKKTVNYKVPAPGGPASQGWPWATGVRQGWSGQRRRQMENQWACQNMPEDVLSSVVAAARADAIAKGRGANITCKPCANGNPCIRRVVGQLKGAQNATCTNGRMGMLGNGGPGTKVAVTVTVEVNIRLAIWCDDKNCGGGGGV